MTASLFRNKKFLVACWAFYDLANQFFALNVVSVYFPRWLTLEKGASEILYSVAFAVSMVFIAVCAPFLGTISDFQKKKNVYLVCFTLISIVFTALLGVFDDVFVALGCFVIANFGCQMAIIFYNAMIVRVTERKTIGMVSGIGRMAGYTGAILAMFLSKPIIKNYGYEATFFMTAALFFLFSLPLMVFVPDDKNPKERSFVSFLTFRELGSIFRRIRKAFGRGAEFRNMKLFLAMFFLGMCVMQTIILFMAVYVSEVFNLSETTMIDLIIVSTVMAILGSFVSGFLADKWGNKKMMGVVLLTWFVGLLAGACLGKPFHWVIGPVLGFALGATWVVGRSWGVHLVPEENLGEMFGLFNLMGYAAGVVGPLCWGGLLYLFSPLGVTRYRISLAFMLIFILLSLSVLMKIPEEQ